LDILAREVVLEAIFHRSFATKFCVERGSFSLDLPHLIGWSRVTYASRRQSLRHLPSHFSEKAKTTTMKLATAALLIAPAVAFSPATSFGVRRTALNMATETASETKVCSCLTISSSESVSSCENPFGIFTGSRWIQLLHVETKSGNIRM